MRFVDKGTPMRHAEEKHKAKLCECTQCPFRGKTKGGSTKALGTRWTMQRVIKTLRYPDGRVLEVDYREIHPSLELKRDAFF